MKFRKIIEFQSSWLVTELHIFLIIDEKELFNIHKISKINCKINQELKLWARRKCPCHLTACVNRWTLWKYYLFVIFSSKRNTRVKTNEIRNIQLSLFFTGFSKCNFYWYRCFSKAKNNNMCRIFCTKIKLLVRKVVLKSSLFEKLF